MEMSEIKHFFGMIKPLRDDFMINYTDEDERIMTEHFTYLKGLIAEKKLVLAGPILNKEKPRGIFIFECDTIEEAQGFLKEDPSIKAGIQKLVMLEPFRLSLIRKD
ncbi:MAG: hypothetical protein FK733_00820 [Asgard group archaeon]|nr:hypothetical protein [Asgard group archaeon]